MAFRRRVARFGFGGGISGLLPFRRNYMARLSGYRKRPVGGRFTRFAVRSRGRSVGRYLRRLR